MTEFEFPGNVRQLENLCHWLTVMAPAQVVEPKDLPPESLGVSVPVAQAIEPGVAARTATSGAAPPPWLADPEREARRRLGAGQPDVWEMLTQQFEGCLIHAALDIMRGRRIEAAQKLGIGRNTSTRKIQELGLAPYRAKCSAAARPNPPHASVTHTGAWSLGRSFLRGCLSMLQAVTAPCSAWLTRMRSMRSPWFLRKARLR